MVAIVASWWPSDGQIHHARTTPFSVYPACMRATYALKLITAHRKWRHLYSSLLIVFSFNELSNNSLCSPHSQTRSLTIQLDTFHMYSRDELVSLRQITRNS